MYIWYAVGVWLHGIQDINQFTDGCMCMVLQEGSHAISFRPNTRLEFASLSCGGEFDKQEYSALNRVCQDCYNLFRDKYVYSNCKYVYKQGYENECEVIWTHSITFNTPTFGGVNNLNNLI